MKRARIGVIGAGWWSSLAHLPALRDDERAEIVGIADPSSTNREAAMRAFEIGVAYEDHADLLTDGNLDAVVIAVPHVLHYAIARDALDAGVHVLLEKPMVLQTGEAWDLVSRAQTNGLELVIGYSSHFTRHAMAARNLIKSGRLGEIRLVSALLGSMVESYYRGDVSDYGDVFDFSVTRPDPRTYSDPAISGGGQAVTQVTHAMGLVLWTTGLRVRELSAFVDGFGLAVDLVDAISYRFDNGGLGSMGSTGSLRPDQPWQLEYRYYGSEGCILHDTFTGTLAAYFNDGTSELFTPLEPDERAPIHAPARCLVDLVLGVGENLAPGEVGARTVEFLDAAYRSAAERRVVGITEMLELA